MGQTQTNPNLKSKRKLKTAKDVNKLLQIKKNKEIEEQKIKDKKQRIEDERKLFTLNED